ncbi:hypothetical protein CHS0354_025435 [Potamilus streckersoni]|uniref:Nuclear speckle splicing regulatory protein 1 N-terminal domain-containing protein n=1 Tax=Potamilus streckersoni TaxID=2493646 RepID=A0AAE0SPS5_9BIVA|nr:hypothetical protein CHS0354_025435 [Potamilus streckersoni]
MVDTSKSKQYGLFIPRKLQQKKLVKTTNVFGNESDEDAGQSGVNATLQKEALKSKVKRQTQLEIDKALGEDPTVYDYDGVYDKIQEEKAKNDDRVSTSRSENKPRYIEGLLKAAEKHKREEERRQEKKVQKEREKEGEEFQDKDVFVTTAYKKKMQEMQELEEQERREAEMEAMLDVTKQKDLSGFYRYILNETVGEKNKQEDAVKPIKQEKLSPSPDKNKHHRSGSEERKDKSRSKSQERQSDERHSDVTVDKQKERHSDDKKERRRSRSREKQKRSDSREKSRKSRSRERHKSRSRDRLKNSRSKETVKNSKQSSKEKQRSKSEEQSRNKSSSPLPLKTNNSSKKHKDEEIEPRDRKEMKSEEAEEKDDDEEMEKQEEEQLQSKYARHTTQGEIKDARERYLARKIARERAKPVVEEEDD